MPNFIETYRQQNRQRTRREIAKDLLVILVLVKISLEYMFRQGSLSPALGIALLIAGIIAIAVRNNLFGNLLSIAAVILFLVDIYFQGNPYSAGLFVILAVIAVGLVIFLRLFSR